MINQTTGEPSGEEVVVHDTPLLINIKGCGYPPEVNCDEYAEFFSNQSELGLTFPCHYSKMNPWVVLSAYSEYGDTRHTYILTQCRPLLFEWWISKCSLFQKELDGDTRLGGSLF